VLSSGARVLKEKPLEGYASVVVSNENRIIDVVRKSSCQAEASKQEPLGRISRLEHSALGQLLDDCSCLGFSGVPRLSVEHQSKGKAISGEMAFPLCERTVVRLAHRSPAVRFAVHFPFQWAPALEIPHLRLLLSFSTGTTFLLEKQRSRSAPPSSLVLVFVTPRREQSGRNEGICHHIMAIKRDSIS
jgi:hypothetical protein